MIQGSIVFVVAIACGCICTLPFSHPVASSVSETHVDPVSEKCRFVSLAMERLVFKSPQRAVIVLEPGRKPVLYIRYKSDGSVPDVEAIVVEGIPVIEGPLSEEHYSRLLQIAQ